MGGHTDLIDHRTRYYETAEFLFNLTVAANLRGDHMPLWGTCLGFELLGKKVSISCPEKFLLLLRVFFFPFMTAAIIVSQNFTIMGNTYFTSTNISLPLVSEMT